MSAKVTPSDRLDALRLLIRTSRPQRGALLVGGLATVGVVAMRLALPWPLRGVVEHVFPGPQDTSIVATLGVDVDPVVLFCLLYLLFAVGAGTFEWIQRLWMARVAGRTAHDLRSRAVASLRSATPRSAAESADLITRVVGDVARIRADLKGILIHLGQNGLLLLAIVALFLVLAPKLGLLFLAAGLLAVLIGYLTVEEVAETAWRHRRKESAYAAAIQDDPDELGGISRSSTRKDVRTTRIIGRATWLIHASVAATLGLALWIGVQDVRAGTLAPGELFLFIAYAITIQRRAVMIGRQIARGGKLLANSHRLGKLIESGMSGDFAGRKLGGTLRLEAASWKRFSGQSKRARLGPIDIELEAGSSVLVVGAEGSGKSSLLALIAGRSGATEGRLVWDGDDVTGRTDVLRDSVAFVPDEPTFGRVRVGGLLGLKDGRDPTTEQQTVLEALGTWRVVGRLREGLAHRVASTELSPRERRALVLGGAVLGDESVWALDNPVDTRRTRDRDRLATILDRGAGRTVVVALRTAVLAERFDRVIALRNGKVAFDGPPARWNDWRAARRTIRSAAP